MSSAYLIIAHNEFEILQMLVSALDYPGNDIYVHFDRKVKLLPDLMTRNSNLYVLDRRIDVRWGHVSQIKTELLLFEEALAHGPYDFYHLISGTHLPLKDTNGLNAYFEKKKGLSVVTGLTKDTEYQETLKMHRINLFLRNYSSRSDMLSKTSQFMWKSCVAVQRWLHIMVNKGVDFWKTSNWLSLSDDAARYIISIKKQILKRYRFTLCGDEFFVATELMNSPLKDRIINDDYYLKCEMQRSNPRIYTLREFDTLKTSGCLFARKFSSK